MTIQELRNKYTVQYKLERVAEFMLASTSGLLMASLFLYLGV
jgi:hypothetical protein